MNGMTFQGPLIDSERVTGDGGRVGTKFTVEPRPMPGVIWTSGPVWYGSSILRAKRHALGTAAVHDDEDTGCEQADLRCRNAFVS